MNALEGIREPFKYNDVYEEGDLIDDRALLQDFKAELFDRLEEERRALVIVPSAISATESYYNEVKREIESSPN